MKKTYSLIISIITVFISLQAMAMDPVVSSLLTKSDSQIKSFRGNYGENIFHHLLTQFQMSGGTDATLNSQIVDSVRRFPELLLIPDNDGQFATDFVEGLLLPLDVYKTLAQRFKVLLYNPVSNAEAEKFMREIAPSLLGTISRDLMVDESALRSQAGSKHDATKADIAKKALARFQAAREVYDNFVINGSRGLLRIQVKGMGIPLFMVPVDYARKEFIEMLFKNDDGGGINAFTNPLFKLEIDRKALKFIDLVNNSYSGLYPAFKNGGGYFDRFFDLLKGDPDYNDPRFLDGILYAMSQVGHQKDGETPVISKMQMDQLLGRFPALRDKIKNFSKPFGGLEAYFDEDIKSQRVHMLLSTPVKMGESFDPIGFVTDAVSKGWYTLPDYLMADFGRGGHRTFADYFRVVSTREGHDSINPGFWDYLYRNPYFNNTKENSAVRAFLIGLDMSMHKADFTAVAPDESFNLEIFRKGVMSSLIKKDDAFTGQTLTGTKAARAMHLMRKANHFIEMYGIEIGVRDEWGGLASPSGQEVISNEILDTMGGFSPSGLNLKRKATKDEFLAAMEALRDVVLEKGLKPVILKMERDTYLSPLDEAGREALKRHREAVVLCAEWMESESSGVPEIDRIKGMVATSSLILPAQSIKERLYRMEDRFNVPGFFIKNRAEVDKHLHDGD
ncbi:MAG: hypothetical protein K2Q34_04220 [Alphaproteobacteria bacterium]|nr:hypothetical protein [Alphaproteobacteria bacterium]